VKNTTRKIQYKIRLYSSAGVILTGIMIASVTFFSLHEGLFDFNINSTYVFHVLRNLILTTCSAIIFIVCAFVIGLNFLMKPLSEQLLLDQDELEELLEKKQKKLKNSNEKLQQLAMEDPLTNIANRRAFYKRFEKELFRCHKKKFSCALFFIDVDEFKLINDQYGHGAGDFLLIHLSQSLLKIVRQDDMVARIGGDEFVILVPKKTDQLFILDMLNRLEKLIRLPIVFEGKKILYSISIGVSICPREGETMDVLLKNADKKMYHNKLHKKALLETEVQEQ